MITPDGKAQPGTSGQIKIGFIQPLTGPAAAFGLAVRAGAQLAIDEWNARGGVLGKRIVPVFVDTQCEARPAVDAASGLSRRPGAAEY